MEQKRVSYEVAKAIKDAGYPQGNTVECYLTDNHNEFYKKGQIVDNTDGEWTSLTKHLADIPTYIEVWLWLWQEKKQYIGLEAKGYPHDGICLNDYQDIPYFNPEEAIVAAIEFIVNNNLLK